MYGYLTDNYAQYDVVEISHNLLLEVAGKKHGTTDTSWLKRAEQLEELGVIDDGYAIPRPAKIVDRLEDAIPGQVHMLLRALCGGTARNPKEAITIQEVALLQSVLTKRLSEYGTSLKSDESTLNALHAVNPDEPMSPSGHNLHRYIMALQVRTGEKEILQQLIGFCQNSIAEQTNKTAAGSLKRPADDAKSRPQKAARHGKSR